MSETKARELFGTDGIRGVAGEPPLDARTAWAVGAALGEWIGSAHLDPEVVIGVDTRESGPWIAESVAGGLASKGVRARYAGIVTTPGVAYLARTGPYAAGVMISASHNPYRDNGIKVLDHSGFKLPDAQEHIIEQEIFRVLEAGAAPSPVVLTPDESLDKQYIEYLASTFGASLDGLHLVVDAGNGAASSLAPELFERFGAQVERMGCAPDGRNINLNCGSLHLDGLRERVLARGADAGVAFDGDADRALFVSGSGRMVDGDAVMLITGTDLHQRGLLTEADGKPAVVATVMSNLGLEIALRDRGIEMVRTQVGDKYVLEEMVRRGARLGGEQSGHIIFRDFATTGDGMLTALRVFEVMRTSGSTLDELAGGFKVYPQRLVNVRVKERRPLEGMRTVLAEIAESEAAFDGKGRVLVRYSGTEPLCRVMVEGPEHEQVEKWAQRIAAVIKEEIGA
ncbi:MAG: phosphoglucosamine mutase [Bryobacteraceae bacterium]